MGRTAFVNARIFDGKINRLLERHTVFIEAERIVSVTDRPVPAGTKVIDCGGRVLLPGLIDAHVHACAHHVLGFMKEAGVRVGFGTDLLGPLENLQMTEFALRAPIFSPFETLAQATSINAEVVGMKGQIGVISPGAYADILVVDGNPLQDIGVWTHDGARVDVIMSAGRCHRNRLGVRDGPH